MYEYVRLILISPSLHHTFIMDKTSLIIENLYQARMYEYKVSNPLQEQRFWYESVRCHRVHTQYTCFSTKHCSEQHHYRQKFLLPCSVLPCQELGSKFGMGPLGAWREGRREEKARDKQLRQFMENRHGTALSTTQANKAHRNICTITGT